MFYQKPTGRIIEIIFAFFCLAGVLSFTVLNLDARQEPARESAAVILKKALEETGIDGARATFFLLKTNRGQYSFVEREFLDLGNALIKDGRPQEAVSILEMASEVFSDSPNIYRFQAVAMYAAGFGEKSLEPLKKMRSIQFDSILADFMKKNEGRLSSTAEDVIEKYIGATGGKEALRAVKTMVVVFSLESTAGRQERMVRMYKRPLYYRAGPENGSRFTATDGKTVWMVSEKGWEKMEENAAAYIRFASIDDWFLDYTSQGISYTFIGLECLDFSPVYHLRRTFSDGFFQDLYFSAATNLLREVRSDYIQYQPFMKSYRSLWNYREVERIKIPYVFIRNVGSLGPPHGGVIEEVKINVPLDDTLFIPPNHESGS
ncbi:MAG: hypothetical protein JXB26_16895 [Candidatus Aminicenantes bacterium]|nr:hypothetical protein [Candidatus Aminicenantes bacterium]